MGFLEDRQAAQRLRAVEPFVNQVQQFRTTLREVVRAFKFVERHIATNNLDNSYQVQLNAAYQKFRTEAAAFVAALPPDLANIDNNSVDTL